MEKALMSILVLWVLVSTGYGGTVYKWVDKEGVVNFTNDHTQIPSQYRDQVQMEEVGESPKVETPAPLPGSPQKSEEAKVDICGKGEDYWRAKVQPWKKQLKEARENLESLKRDTKESVEGEAGKRLSATQWNTDIAYRRQLMRERSKYEAQLREANEMLRKIAKDAEEAKANPGWLK
jgi:hypothetical protein